MKDINTAYYAVIIGEFVTFAILIALFIYIFKSFKNAQMQPINVPPQQPQGLKEAENQMNIIEKQNEQAEKNMKVSENDQKLLYDKFVKVYSSARGRAVNKDAFNKALLDGNLVMIKTTNQVDAIKREGYKLLTTIFQLGNADDGFLQR